MKIIIREPDALRGYEKNGQSKARTYVFDSDIATDCKEIHVSFNKFGMICTDVKNEHSNPRCVLCGTEKRWTCINENCNDKR
jgi:hypothetical protein